MQETQKRHKKHSQWRQRALR